MPRCQWLWILLLLFSVSQGADIPGPVATPGELIVADDFQQGSLDARWKVVVKAFDVVDGALQGTQAREDHGAVIKTFVPFRDAVIECRFRLQGAKVFNVVVNDKECKTSHAGHICRVTVSPRQIRLSDDREGAMRNDIFELRKDPQRKAEGDKLLDGTFQNVPVKLQEGKWYRLAVEIAGDEMRVCLDGQPIGYLKSPGIGHATKSDFGFSVSGQVAEFDDVKLFAAKAP